VRVVVRDEPSRGLMRGLLDVRTELEAELAWVGDGLIMFETAHDGALQDALRRGGRHVVGGSAFGDRLEQERDFAQHVLSELGLRTLPTHRFHAFEDAIAFVRDRRQRFVLKFNGAGFACSRNYVGMCEDGRDLVAALRHQARCWTAPEAPDFVLMEFADGVEVGCGAYFDGEKFLRPYNLDWEHKRLFPGDLGELTGEMGTLCTHRGADRLFDATLGRLAPRLRAARHHGYVNLNTIVNERGVWPLELTCRFGYPGFTVLGALLDEPWDRVLSKVAGIERAGSIAVHDGWSVGVVLTVPPFPYTDGYERLSRGMPISIPALDDARRAHLWYGEMALEDEELVTAGLIGYVMVVTGRGGTVEAAQRDAYALAREIAVPNVRYRIDIGERFLREDGERLRRLGWLP